MIFWVYKFCDFDGIYKTLISTNDSKESNIQLMFRCSEVYKINSVTNEIYTLKNRNNYAPNTTTELFSTKLFQHLLTSNNSFEIYISHVSKNINVKTPLKTILNFSNRDYQRIFGLDIIDHECILEHLKFILQIVGGIEYEI